MVTVSSLKRALTVDPNEPRPSSSPLMIDSSLKNLSGKGSSGNYTFFGGTNGILKAIISGY